MAPVRVHDLIVLLMQEHGQVSPEGAVMADARPEEKRPQELAESLVQDLRVAQHLDELFEDRVLAALPRLHVEERGRLPPGVVHHVSCALLLGDVLVQERTDGFSKDARIQLPDLSLYAGRGVVIKLFFLGNLQQIPSSVGCTCVTKQIK